MKRVFSRNRHFIQQIARCPREFQQQTQHGLNNLICRRYCQTVDMPVGEARKIDPAAVRPFTTVYYIDTLAVCTKLEDAGFKKPEAEALTKVMSDVIGSAMDHQTRLTVTKPQQEIMVQQLLAQIASVKKDMVILEKSEFTMIRNDTEKQGILIKQLEGQLADGMKKLQGQVRLDINLEKTRAVEAHAFNEKNLQSLVNRLDVEHAKNETNLKVLENKIDVEVSNLRTQNEKNRNDVQKYLIGLVLSGGTLFLAYLRLVG